MNRSLVGAINGGAASVGVFVDESADTIVRRARDTNLTFVQLHGDGARESLPDLPTDMKVIYVLQCSPDGKVMTPAPSQLNDGKNENMVRALGVPFESYAFAVV